MTDLLALTLDMQIALVAGYLGFSAATAGLKHGLRTEDGVFQILVYALPAALILQFDPESYYRPAAMVLAVGASYGMGLIWRRWLQKRWLEFLYNRGLTTEDSRPSVIDTIIHNQEVEWSQISVMLSDGTKYDLAHPENFTEALTKPVIIDKEGSIALYADHMAKPGEQLKALDHIQDGEYGDLLTYIPASQIKRLQIRLRRPVSR